MRIIIQKSPMINGEVALMVADGSEYWITDYYEELNLAVPEETPMQVLLLKYQRVFGPTGSDGLFRDGAVYTIMELRGNELLIQDERDGNYLRWIALN